MSILSLSRRPFFVCLFVCLFVWLRFLSHSRIFQWYRDVTVSNFDLCFALMAIQQWGLLGNGVPYLLWHGTAFCRVFSSGLSLPLFNDSGLLWPGFEQPPFCMQGERCNVVTNWAITAVPEVFSHKGFEMFIEALLWLCLKWSIIACCLSRPSVNFSHFHLLRNVTPLDMFSV